jgi:hypothetical protein
MFIPGFSEELGRPDDFHDDEAGRRSRLTKLQARGRQRPFDQGKLEVMSDTKLREAQEW